MNGGLWHKPTQTELLIAKLRERRDEGKPLELPECIAGKDPGREFDLDTLLGVEVALEINHNRGADGKLSANVRRIIKPKTKTRAEEAEEQRAARPQCAFLTTAVLRTGWGAPSW